MTNTFEKDHFYLSVGATIRAARQSAGLSETELAKRARIAHSTVNNAEMGSTCSLLVITKIAEALDCTLDALVPTEATR